MTLFGSFAGELDLELAFGLENRYIFTMATSALSKIAVIGNGGGGKTTLSRQLGKTLQLPVTHVDSIQFLAGMKVRPHRESIQILESIQAGPKWIVDGYGPLDIIEKRFAQADRILFIDFPLWRHYWWCTKRQLKSPWIRRAELGEGCDEATLAHTIKLFKTLWRVHRQMRPELLRILGREGLKSKVVFVRSLREWQKIYRDGLV